MQETGNNINPIQKKLSIRLSPDGLSFLVQDGKSSKGGYINGTPNPDAIDKLAEKTGTLSFSSILVLMDTPKTIVIPAPLFEENLTDQFLKLHSMELQPDQTTIVSTESAGVSSLMIWDHQTIEALYRHWGTAITFYAPLQLIISTIRKHELRIDISRTLAHIVFCDEKTEFAETLPWQGIPDILYYIRYLESLFDLTKTAIRISGQEASRIVKELRRYFKHTETDPSPLLTLL